MKRRFVFLSVAAFLMAGCVSQPEEGEQYEMLPIHVVTGESCFEIKACDTVPIVGDVYLDVQNEFTLAWPDLEMFDASVRKELMFMAFGDSSCATMDEAGQKFLGRTWVEDDEYLFGGMEPKKVKLDSVRVWPYNYATVKGEVRQDGQLLHFSVNREEFVAYAAHGTYSFHSLIVDRATGKAVRLADLMDTAGIGRVMIRALEELEKNKENGNSTECLSDEYTKCLPEPDGFTMDSNRTVVTAFYNIYSVQAYGCGMLFVDMPVDWLSGQVTLTPYGKKIFGIEEGKKK